MALTLTPPIQGSELGDKAQDAAGDAKGEAKNLASKAEDKVSLCLTLNSLKSGIPYVSTIQ